MTLENLLPLPGSTVAGCVVLKVDPPTDIAGRFQALACRHPATP